MVEKGNEEVLNRANLTTAKQAGGVKKKKRNTSKYSATGSISKSSRNYLSNTPGKNGIKYVTTENKHTGHFAYHSEGTNVGAQSIYRGK